MRKRLMAALAFAVILAYSGSVVHGQSVPWRLVSGSDGVLFVMQGDVKHRIVPAAMSDADMAVTEGDAWEDGVIANAPTASAPSQPVAPPPPPAAPVSAPSAGKHIGETTVLTTPAGLRLTITVNGIEDPVQSSNQFNKPSGRWVLVDWTIKNEGALDFDPTFIDFKLQTADGFLITRGNPAGHRTPQLDTSKLAPGQQVRGYLVYDVPAGQPLKAAIFQPAGARQFVIADLP